MTVQDLIDALSTFDASLPVVMPSENGPEFCLVDSALLDLVRYIDETHVELTDERETEWLRVVRLFGADL